MKTTALALGLLASAIPYQASAAEGSVPRGVPHLEHVFVIMMENHGYSQIIDNPNAPFINKYAKDANLGTNYFAIAHPSLTNYLEIVGGSNFGVLTDNYPDWHSATCSTNLALGVTATDTPASPLICPIAGTGIDADTPAFDFTNETQGSPGEVNIDGHDSISAARNTIGKTIADQLVARHRTLEELSGEPPAQRRRQGQLQRRVLHQQHRLQRHPAAAQPTPQRRARSSRSTPSKHNPFVYFKNVQDGREPWNSLRNIVSFDGQDGLYSDLRSGNVPSLAFIAPNQCNDQHGRGNAGPFCNFDPSDDGSQAGLNPALIYQGDVTVQKLVTAIHASRAWHDEGSAIVVVWDENDYSLAPNNNQVIVIVDTNYGRHGITSAHRYTHFSLLKSMEAGFELPCLNHACDGQVAVMSDLFGR